MNKHTPESTTPEVRKPKHALRHVTRLGAIGLGLVLVGTPIAERISPMSELYEESKSDKTINVAVVDYTGELDEEQFATDVEQIMEQATEPLPEDNDPSISLDVDVLEPSSLNKTLVDTIPAKLPISPVLADISANQSPTEYDSIVSVVNKNPKGVSIQLLPQTKYSHVSRDKDESQTETAWVAAHELGHQLELGHIWALDPGVVETDIMGRTFVDIYRNSKNALYQSYDGELGNLMGGQGKVHEKEDGTYVMEIPRQDGTVVEKEINLSSVQIDKLYEYSDDHHTHGFELTPDSENDSMTILPQKGEYVTAKFPEKLEWDSNAQFDEASGYERISIDSLIVEPKYYEKDGQKMVHYDLFAADTEGTPQLLNIRRALEDHPADEDFSQTISVNGLGFDIDYSNASVDIRAVKDLEPVSGK